MESYFDLGCFINSQALNEGIQRGEEVIDQQATTQQAYFIPISTIIYNIADIVGLNLGLGLTVKGKRMIMILKKLPRERWLFYP